MQAIAEAVPDAPHEDRAEPRRHPGVRLWLWLARSGVLLVLPAMIGLALMFFVPLGRIVWQSINEHPTPLGQTEYYLGLGNYTSMFTDGYTIKILTRTLTLSGTVAIVTGILAYPFAYMLTIVTPRTRAILITIVLVPFWTSGLARTFAWVIILQQGGPIDEMFGVVLRGTSTGVLIGMAQLMLPFAVLPMYSVMQGIERNLISAGESLGASRVASFWRIYFPLSLPGATTGVTLVFVLALGFYLTPALLGSTQQSLIAQLLVIRTQLLDFGGAGALGIFVLVVTLAVLGIGAWLTKLAGSRVTSGSMAGRTSYIQQKEDA